MGAEMCIRDSSLGDDLVYGGRGNDRLMGNEGDDLLFGQRGNDLFECGEGPDLADGGPGNDEAAPELDCEVLLNVETP